MLERTIIEKIIDKAVNKAFDAANRIHEKKPSQIDTAIRIAVKQGMEAGYQAAQKRPKDAFKATEKRLYAMADLKDKIESDIAYLEQIKVYGLPERSTDIIRFQRSGSQTPYDDIIKAVTMDVEARIARNQFAINELQEALDLLTSDEYYRTVPGKYFKHLPDDIIADEFKCDTSTIWRNRARLVNRIAVRLYGIDAL